MSLDECNFNAVPIDKQDQFHKVFSSQGSSITCEYMFAEFAKTNLSLSRTGRWYKCLSSHVLDDHDRKQSKPDHEATQYSQKLKIHDNMFEARKVKSTLSDELLDKLLSEE